MSKDWLSRLVTIVRKRPLVVFEFEGEEWSNLRESRHGENEFSIARPHERLAGRYLRQGAFLDLIRSGYIGAHSDTTAHLDDLVRAVLQGNRAVVAAVQSRIDDADTDIEEF